MSITGLHSNVSRNVVAKNSIKLVDVNGVEIVDIDAGFANFGMPIKTNEIQPHENNEVFLNANTIKTKYGTGYLKSDEHGVITSSNPSAADIVLPHKNMLVGNTSGIAKTSSVIQCEGEEVKSVAINAEPNQSYSLVVGSKTTMLQNLLSRAITIREDDVSNRIANLVINQDWGLIFDAPIRASGYNFLFWDSDASKHLLRIANSGTVF